MSAIEDILLFKLKKIDYIPTVYFLFEGANSEPYLLGKLLDCIKDFLYGKVNVVLIRKTKEDTGCTTPEKLVKLAKEKILTKEKFAHGYDKVIIVFDLDIYNNDQEKINHLMQIKSKDMVYMYTNPAFELFIFLLSKDSLNEVLLPHKEEILRNEFKTICGKKSHKRYIYWLASSYLHINTKKKTYLNNMNYKNIIQKMENAFVQEKSINRSLFNAANNLTSNVAYVIEKLINDELDKVMY